MKKKMQKVYIIVERPDGSTYEQIVYAPWGKESHLIISQFQTTTLGDPYRWITINGRRERILRNDIYLAVDCFAEKEPVYVD